MTTGEVERALAETKRAAKDLAGATARLTKHLLEKADDAAKNPAGSVHKAVKTVARELDSMSKEIERLLKEL